MICGRELDKDKVRSKLLKKIGDYVSAISRGRSWRIENTLNEMSSCTDLLRRISNGLEYSLMTDTDNKPNKQNISNICENHSSAIIFTSNPTHIDYIERIGETSKMNILCEKPLCTLTNEYHSVDDSQLKRLEDVVGKKRDELIYMDSEHYSAKKASIIFFERLGDMVSRYGRISSIDACTLEKDDPEKERTRNLLRIRNRTGLLLDMGVHLFGILTGIGGSVNNISSVKYEKYPGHIGCNSYDVETYCDVKFSLGGNFFHENAEGHFEFAKFIDKSEKYHKIDDFGNVSDSKVFNVKFKNMTLDGLVKDTLVTLDFRKGTVTDSTGFKWMSYSSPSDEEYVNILGDFNNAIVNHQTPRTSFENSLKTLKTIFRVYKDFPINNPSNYINFYSRACP